MPWPTGTSTAGLRVAHEGVLPPKPVQPPPPPPKRRILDTHGLGSITGTDVTEKGIKVTLEDGKRLLLPFGLVGPEDIARVTIAPDGQGIVLTLRNGETLEYSLVRIRALSETLEERKETS
jgi:hypothetical protein